MANSQGQYSEIVDRQRRFFQSQNTRSIEFRIEQLLKLKQLLLQNESIILQALYDDLRKPKQEAYLSEIGVLVEEIDFIAKNLKSWAKAKPVSTPLSLFPARSKIYSDPYGVVAVFAPWNYPVQLVLSPAIGALAAGNCVLLKPADLTPHTQNVLLNIINSNFDPGLIHAIGGGVPESEQLLKEKLDYIFFTGSPRVGKIVMRAATENLTPVCLELGGKSPCIVDDDANIKVSARRIVWAKFFNAGQTCVAPDYVCVHKSVKTSFLVAVRECLNDFFGPSPQDCEYLARIVTENHLKRLVEYLDSASIYCGGEYDLKTRYLAPTVLNNVNWNSKIMQDEIFGPIMPILEFDEVTDVIEKINQRPKPLALYYFTESTKRYERMIEQTSSGGVCINDCVVHLANPNLPFGGVGTSGMGAYHGEHSYSTLSHEKSVLVNTTKIDVPLRYPPYTKDKMRWLRRFF